MFDTSRSVFDIFASAIHSLQITFFNMCFPVFFLGMLGYTLDMVEGDFGEMISLEITFAYQILSSNCFGADHTEISVSFVYRKN